MANYRNMKALKSADGQYCRHCFINDSTIVAAHSNQQKHGKGMGIKAHDCFIAYLCHECHQHYDSGKMTAAVFEKAMWFTQQYLINQRILTAEKISELAK